MSGLTVYIDKAGLDAMLDGLAGDIESAVRPMAFAASDVLYKDVKRNVAAIGRQTGNLERAIYQAYSENSSGPGKATYHISWNARKAPHGHLVEFGHIQRYASYVGSDGKWHTAVRPSMRGKPAPKGRASQATKDAYYVLRKGGAVQVAAKPFIRTAASQSGAAIAAARAKLFEILDAK